MQMAEPSDQDLGRIPRLSPDCDPTALELTAAEGFLLSRIDGHTPWRLLRQIGGLPAADVDACLARWLESGLLQADAPPSAKPRPIAKSASQAAPIRPPAAAQASSGEPEIDEGLIDEALDLDPKIQRRILEFEARLGSPYHALLGVDADADPKTVKRAYFGLSKEFHPDRYFRRQIGDYIARLERIFKKVLEAYEVLSDPKLRAELEAHDAQAGPVPAGAQGGGTSTPRKLSKLELLRHRMPFKLPESVLNERRDKGRALYKSAQISARRERWQEADANLRLALTFDPANREYRSQLGEYRMRAVEERALRLLDVPDDELDPKLLKKAYTMLEEVVAFRPQDCRVNLFAGRLALDLDMADAAMEHAQSCVEHGDDVSAHHTLLGRVYQYRGDRGHAVQAFERALELNAEDADARKALALLRLGRRDAARGGQG